MHVMSDNIVNALTTIHEWCVINSGCHVSLSLNDRFIIGEALKEYIVTCDWSGLSVADCLSMGHYTYMCLYQQSLFCITSIIMRSTNTMNRVESDIHVSHSLISDHHGVMCDMWETSRGRVGLTYQSTHTWALTSISLNLTCLVPCWLCLSWDILAVS